MPQQQQAPPTPAGPSPLTQAQEWFRELPPVTRALFGSTLIISLLGGFGIINPYSLILYLPSIIQDFQFWRLLTCFFFSKLGFNFLMHLYFLYQNSLLLETTNFANKPADYAFFIFFSMASLLVLGVLFTRPVLTDSLLLAIIYLWAQLNPDQPMTFMFGMRFQAVYFPWVLVGFDFLSGDSFPIGKLMGIVVGHLYYFLTNIYPHTNGGRVLLKTPDFLRAYLPDTTPPGNAAASGSTTGTADKNRSSSTSGGNFRSWGKGHKLGSS